LRNGSYSIDPVGAKSWQRQENPYAEANEICKDGKAEISQGKIFQEISHDNEGPEKGGGS
jgi:hypothetical protein